MTRMKRGFVDSEEEDKPLIERKKAQNNETRKFKIFD